MIGNICEYISNIINRKIAEKNNFVVCELFTGHGVGRLLHVPPMIMHHCKKYKILEIMIIKDLWNLEMFLL